MSSQLLIELVGVEKVYGGEIVLKDIDLEIYDGDYICIRGRSGVGKTSLLRIVSLLSLPSSGKVFFMGRDVTSLGDFERSVIRARYFGVVFQGETLISTLTGYENIVLGFDVKGLDVDDDFIDSIMVELGISHLRDRYPDTFSAGEKQRVAIARALVGTPRVLVLDEPFANLDDKSIDIINGVLDLFNGEYGTTIVMSTTELYSSLPCGRRFILRDSRLYPE
jgi:putative ABC transport system ATP-binding protein